MIVSLFFVIVNFVVFVWIMLINVVLLWFRCLFIGFFVNRGFVGFSFEIYRGVNGFLEFCMILMLGYVSFVLIFVI